MESIDRLREYGARFNNSYDAWSGIGTEILEFADEIEHDFDDMWHALTIDAKPMTDENMAEHGWVRLPMDADGEVIHIGDLVDEKLPFGGYAAPAPIDTMELSRGASGYVWMVKLDDENRAFINPKLLRHHHEPTVEDVLREFAYGLGVPVADSYVAATAAKLRLAESE